MKYLLDVNALIAAVWTDHAHHSVVDAWVRNKPLFTCPLTELGFLRISTHPRALAATMAEARRLLQDFISKHQVEFVCADLPALESKANDSEGVTDYYLASLAAKNDLKLASLDRAIAHPAVVLISP
jgi:toxin-antitoxin system PIN domain toxin